MVSIKSWIHHNDKQKEWTFNQHRTETAMPRSFSIISIHKCPSSTPLLPPPQQQAIKFPVLIVETPGKKKELKKQHKKICKKRWRRFIKYKKKSAIVHGFKNNNNNRKKNCRCYFSYVYLNTTPKATHPHSPHTLINWRMRKETHKWRVSEWIAEWESEWESNDYCIFFIYSSWISLSPPVHPCCSHTYRIYAAIAVFLLAEKEVKRRWWCKAMLLYLCLNYQIPFAWQQTTTKKKQQQHKKKTAA